MSKLEVVFSYSVTACLAIFFLYVCFGSYAKLMNPVVITISSEESGSTIPVPSFTFFTIEFFKDHPYLDPGSNLTLEEVYFQDLPDATDLTTFSGPG